MRLAARTDYALRILMYLGRSESRAVPVAEISDRFHISENHLMKVAQLLSRYGWIRAQRGRHGGFQLAAAPEGIGIGAVVRACEPDFELVECFQPDGGNCVIRPGCALEGTLREALRDFLERLDRCTLADLVRRPAGSGFDVNLGSLALTPQP